MVTRGACARSQVEILRWSLDQDPRGPKNRINGLYGSELKNLGHNGFLLEHWPESLFEQADKFLSDALKSGYIEAVSYLWRNVPKEHFHVSFDRDIAVAIANKHVEVAQWLYKNLKDYIRHHKAFRYSFIETESREMASLQTWLDSGAKQRIIAIHYSSDIEDALYEEDDKSTHSYYGYIILGFDPPLHLEVIPCYSCNSCTMTDANLDASQVHRA